MAIRRKCKKCDTWNGDNDYCTSCGNVLSPQIIEEIREQEREKIRRNEPKGSLDRFIEGWENHRFLLLRIMFKIVYGISAVIMAIAFFLAYITVGSNG